MVLQDNSIKYDIEWNLICRANTFSTISNTCNLCINEKMYILYFPEFGSLNSRSEQAGADITGQLQVRPMLYTLYISINLRVVKMLHTDNKQQITK